MNDISGLARHLPALVNERRRPVGAEEIGHYGACDNGWTPLHAAVAAGHLEMVQFLVDAGADLEAPGADKSTLL